jgi:cytochrome b561
MPVEATEISPQFDSESCALPPHLLHSAETQMISEALHLLACIALVFAAAYWRRNLPDGRSAYRHLLPFNLAAGILGVVILYRYGIEFFVASYSGAIYEVEAPSRGAIALIAVSAMASALPLAGLLPMIGRRASAMMFIGCLSAIPSLLALAAGTQKHQEPEHAETQHTPSAALFADSFASSTSTL